jgi:hypothetical protein
MIRQAENTRRGIPMAMVMVIVAGLLALAFAFSMATRNTSSGTGTGAGAGSAPIAQASGSKAGSAVAAKVTVRLYDRQFTSSTSDQAGPRARTRFSSSADNQLYVQMTWSGVEQTHDAYVTFYSPDGKIYQVLNVPFTTTQPDAKSGSGDLYQNRPGVLHPVKVSRAQMTAQGAVVWGQLPIAGTWMGRMPGNWQVEVRLDQNPDSLAKTQFVLAR